MPEAPYNPWDDTEMDSGWYPIRMLYMDERMTRVESELARALEILKELQEKISEHRNPRLSAGS